ncbi:MAG: FG-GAP repeat domain-containing protein [Candidatus Hodarchaeota archaeon]
MKKKSGILVVIIFIAIAGSVYIGYRLYKPYKRIKIARERWGVETPCESIQSPSFIRGKWSVVLIDKNIKYTDGAHNIIPYDLDKDGKIELIADSYRSDTLILYKYRAEPHLPDNWSRYVIDSAVGGHNPRGTGIQFIKSIVEEKLLGGFTSGAHYTAIADINGDGRQDLFVAGDCKSNDIVWYESPENPTDISAWTKHVVYQNDSHRTYHIETGYVDADSHVDIVFTSKTDNSIGWLQNNASPLNWTMTWIDKDCIRCFNAKVADIDKDGRNDVIASEDNSSNGGTLHLYRFSDDPGRTRNWMDFHLAQFQPGEGVSVFEIVDIDRDGDLDIVAANHQGSIYILRNPYANSVLNKWDTYKITARQPGNTNNFREIDVGDVDGDGDFDIVVADEGQNQVVWFENEGQPFVENWKKHNVDQSHEYLRWCHSVEFGDVDGDGDLDIAVAAAASNVFLLYLNNLDRQGSPVMESGD